MLLNRLTQSGKLDEDNKLLLKEYQEDAEEYMDLHTPNEDANILDIINYYMLSQKTTAALENSYWVSMLNEEEAGFISMEEYIARAKAKIDNGEPFLITYYYASGGGHATVALDYWEDEKEEKFYIKIFDENRVPYTGWKAEENRTEYKPFDYVEIGKTDGEYDASKAVLYTYYPQYGEIAMNVEDAWTNIYLGNILDEDGKINKGNAEGLYVKDELLYLVMFDMAEANKHLDPENGKTAKLNTSTDPVLKVFDLWTSYDNLFYAMDVNTVGGFAEVSNAEDVTIPYPAEAVQNTEKLIRNYRYSYDSDGSRKNPEDDTKPLANIEITLNPEAQDSYAVVNMDATKQEWTHVEFYRPNGSGGGQFTGLKAKNFEEAYFHTDGQLKNIIAPEKETMKDMALYIGTIGEKGTGAARAAGDMLNGEMETSMFYAEVPESTYFEVYDADDKDSYAGSLVLHTDAFFYKEGMNFIFFDGADKSGTFFGTPRDITENSELDTWWKIRTDVTQDGEIYLYIYAPVALPAEGELPEFGEKEIFSTNMGKADDGWNQTSDGDHFYFKYNGKTLKGSQKFAAADGSMIEYLFDDDAGYLLTGWQKTEDGNWAYYEEKGGDPRTSSYGIRYVSTTLTAKANSDIIPADEIVSGREYIYTFDENGILSGYKLKPVSSDSSGSTSSGGGSANNGSSGNKKPTAEKPTTPETTTETEINADGSTTTTVTDEKTGTVTETTEHTDGSQVVVETKNDGTETVTTTTADGTTSVTVTDADGNLTENSVAISEKAAESGETVTLPIQSVNTSQETAVKVELPANAEAVKVEIPVEDASENTVAVIVYEDGTEEIVKTSVLGENGVVLKMTEGATAKIVDNSTEFTDVHGAEHWAEKAVDFASARNLFSGMGDGMFSPDTAMSRGMLAKVLHNLENNPETIADNSFADVADGAWYAEAVAWAAEKGIVSGYDNGLFGVNDPVTREQLAVMLYRYAGSPAASGSIDRFADAENASAYAETALCWAVENGIISGMGDNQLAPSGEATRAQVAQMLKNFVQNVMVSK